MNGILIRRVLHGAVLLLLALAIVLSAGMPAQAYFHRGDVDVSLGRSSVAIRQGGSETVSVSFSPSSDRQLPGCGMAECPQTCGEKECLNDDNQCTCAGTIYHTYYASAKVTSSNTSVASARYRHGGLQIRGISAGTATITVTASLRQYDSTSKTLRVRVTGAAKKSRSGSSGGSASSVGRTAKNDTATAVRKSTAAGQSKPKTKAEKKAAAKKKAKQSEKKIRSRKGIVYTEDIIDYANGSDLFRKIKGKKEYALFQKKGSGENVLYSWEFDGRELENTHDVNMTLSLSDTAGKKIRKAAHGKETVYLHFTEQKEFPGPARLYINMKNYCRSGDKLYLYRYDDSSGKAVPMKDTCTVKDDYLNRTFTRGGTYLLTRQEIPAHPHALLIAAGIAVAAGAVAVIISAARRRKEL